MLKKLMQHWENLYTDKTLDIFLRAVKDSFDSDELIDDVIKLLHRYNQLDRDKNNGILSNQDYMTLRSEISSSVFKIFKSITNNYLPILPVNAIAGTESGHQYAVEGHEIEEWKYKEGIASKNRIGIRVQGQSMEPLYVDGDILVCEKLLLGNINERQKVVVVDTDNNIYIKQIKKNVNKLVLISINPKYEPFEIPLADIKEYWKVVNKLR